MGTYKVNVGVKIPPKLKESLEGLAAKEDRSVSQLCEILLAWSSRMLGIAGNSIVLKDMTVTSDPNAEALRRMRAAMDLEAEVAGTPSPKAETTHAYKPRKKAG